MNPKKIFDWTVHALLPGPILFFLMSVLCCGCSAGTDYWTNRLDDTKDIVSFTAGSGFGIKVQANCLISSPDLPVLTCIGMISEKGTDLTDKCAITSDLAS